MAWYQKHKARRRVTPRTTTPAQQAYLDEVRAMAEVPRRTAQALLPLYITMLDDLLPLLDGPRLLRDWSNGNASSCLVAAVCLVICKSPQAVPYLWLDDVVDVSDLAAPGRETPLPALEFASRLLRGLDAALKADLEPDRVTRVRVLALMHLHTDGAGGLDRALVHLSQAISEAWCLSLHHRQPGADDSAAATARADEYALLWWTLRHLDRLNKPITAAGPFIIDDSNVGLARIGSDGRPISYKQQVAQVATSLGDLMVFATRVYKPHLAAREDLPDEFPTFETVIGSADLQDYHAAHRQYFEIWYHVAAMLSCRYSPPGTIQYDRRLSSAGAVLAIIGDDKEPDLPPLPLIPYAMAMSTTVLYRALRDNKRDASTGLAQLRRCCDVLKSLGNCWTSVHGICRLAREICKPNALAPSRMQDGPAFPVDGHSSSGVMDGVANLASITVGVPPPDVDITGPGTAASSTMVMSSSTDMSILPDTILDDVWASHLDPSSYFLMDPIFHTPLDYDVFSALP